MEKDKVKEMWDRVWAEMSVFKKPLYLTIGEREKIGSYMRDLTI